MKHSELLQYVERYVMEYAPKKCTVNLETEIYQDAGFYGEDLYDLFSHMSNKFNVAFHDLSLRDFAPGEGWIILLFRNVSGNTKVYKSLKVKDVVSMIEKGDISDG